MRHLLSIEDLDRVEITSVREAARPGNAEEGSGE